MHHLIEAWQAELFPLLSAEIPDFDVDRYLRYGGLPQVYGADDPDEELDAYLNTYIKEEVREEALGGDGASDVGALLAQ